MAAKSIIEVDVNDERFKEYLELFNKYRDEVKKLPDAWEEVGKAVDGNANGSTTQGFQNMTAAVLAVGFNLSKQLSTLNQLRQQASQTSSIFDKIKKSTHDTVGDLKEGTLSLLKWASLLGGVGGTIIGGLGLGGALYGLDRLAGAAYGVRRSSQGLGVTPGEQQAFQLNYARYLDPMTVLGNVATARTDLSQRWAFGALGLSNIDQQDPEQLAVQATLRAKQLLTNLGPQGQLTNQWAQATGLSTFFSLDDLRRLQASPLSALQASASQTATDAQSFALNPKTLLNWTNFNTALERAGTLLKDTLITDLSALTPSLTALSASLSHALAGILGNPALKTDMDDLAKGLNKFAAYAGSPAFAADVDNFAAGMSQLVGAVLGAVQWLGGGSTAGWGTTANGSPVPPWAKKLPGWLQPVGSSPSSKPGAPAYPANPDQQIWSMNWGGLIGAGSRGALGNWDFTNPAQKYKLDPALLKNIKLAESGSLGMSPDSSAGAQGVFQLMPGTQSAYGVTNPYDVGQEAYAAAAYMNDLLNKYNMDLQKAVAAYNWGPGNVDKDVAQNGQLWLNKAPLGVRAYVDHVTNGVTPNGRVVLEIVNSTGGNASVISNQLANQSQ